MHSRGNCGYDKGKPDQSQGRKATGPRFLREASVDSPKDPKIAGLPSHASIFHDSKSLISEGRWNVNSRFFVLVSTLLLTVSWPVLAQSGDDEVRCKDIRGQILLISFEENCNFEGEDYLWCFGYELKGKAKGTWQVLIKTEWAEIPIDPFVDTIDGSANLWFREDHVLDLRRGRLIGSAQYIVDTRLWDIGGNVPISAVVTAGTGIYQDASGWILSTSQDFFTTAAVSGEVCGPYVPGQEDHED